MEIHRIAVLGTGQLGREIAENAAGSGCDVTLVSLGGEKEDALQKIEESLDRKLAKWAITEAEKRVILGRITPTDELEAIKQADLVIEAADEKLEAKQKALKEADQVCPPEVVFITTSAVFPVSELAEGLIRQKSLVGLHFIQPVPDVPVAELSTADFTEAAAAETAATLGKKLGKKVIQLPESTGLPHPRVFAVMVNETVRLLETGVSADELDDALKTALNMAQGPLELADRLGLDVLLYWLEQLRDTLGERFAPNPLIARYVQENRLGLKTGQGFLRYNAQGKRQ